MAHEFTRLMKNITVRLPGALEDVIKLELFTVLDEFFQESSLWKEDIPITTTAGRTDYEIEPDEHSSIVRLMGVKDAWDRPVAASLKTEPTVLLLNREMDAGTALTATVAMTVVDPVDTEKFPLVPDWIVVKYQRAIEHGVLYRMMSQPSKPYTNSTLAEFHRRQFNSAKSLARIDATHEHLYDGQRWRFPHFAGR